MRPVPVVLRPMALVDQLSVERKGEGSLVSLASGRRPTLLEKDALFYFFSRAERSSVDVQLRFRAEG